MVIRNEEKILKQNSLNSEINIEMGVTKTVFQCYKWEFVKGETVGKWEKTGSTITYGENATTEMLIDGSGYYITDSDNNKQYFVDTKQLSKTENLQ